MALVRVFSSKGVKTVEMLGNVSEQAYDEPIDEIDPSLGDQDPDAEE